MAVTRVRPGKTGTPPGMEGVRPGSPKAVAAGYRPPAPPKPPGRPGGAPFSPSFNPDGTTTLKPPAPPAAPAPSTTTTTTMEFKPDASWWSKQFGGHELYRQNMPILRSKEEGAAASYGYRIMRNAAGQPIFKSKGTGATGITQALDEKGNPLVVLNEAGRPVYQYKDAEGKLYAPEDLEMDIQRIQKGEAGYLEGALGAAEAGSEKRQFDIGDVASRTVGARRSGMRASTAASETQALQSALAGLTGRAAGEFGGIQSEYRDLYNQIYSDLLKSAAATPGTEVTTTTPTSSGTAVSTPVSTAMPGVPQKPLPAPRTISIAGQDVSFPKGINLAGVDVQGIGRRIANNITAVGGVSKLKPGQKVGEFRAGDKGYRVFHRAGKFVIEAIG